VDTVETRRLHRLVLLCAAGAVLIQLVYGLRYRFGPIDDAYIHLRVAQNLVRGDGPVFNVGDRVEVTSSPLWTLLLGAGLRAGLSSHAVILLGALGSAALAGAAAAWLGAEVAGTPGVVASLLLATLPGFAAWTGSGMETPLAVAAVASATASMLATTSVIGVVRTALLSSLLCYLRPELMACAPSLIGLAVLSLPRRDLPRALIAGAAAWIAPLAVLFLSRHWYFGEWLPNTYYAKVAGGGIAQRVKGLQYVGHFASLHPVYFILAGAALIPAGAAERPTGVRQDALLPVACRRPVHRVAIVLANFLLAIVWAGGDGFYFARLALPALPLLAAMSAATLLRFSGVRMRVFALAAALVLQVGWSFRGTGEFGRYMVGPIFAENSRSGVSCAPFRREPSPPWGSAASPMPANVRSSISLGSRTSTSPVPSAPPERRSATITRTTTTSSGGLRSSSFLSTG
jgi:arabinofuranosyltransferase